MILRVKKRGDGWSASPTVHLKGEKGPWCEGPLGAFWGVPSALWLRQRRSASKRNRRTLRGPQPCSRARDGGGGRGGWMVLGRWGRGGVRVDGFAGDGL